MNSTILHDCVSSPESKRLSKEGGAHCLGELATEGVIIVAASVRVRKGFITCVKCSLK